MFEPVNFLRRLAAAIPRPRQNLIRFHGCFAANHKRRPDVVALALGAKRPLTPARQPITDAAELACRDRGPDSVSLNTDRAGSVPRPYRRRWAELLKHIFDHDTRHWRTWVRGVKAEVAYPGTSKAGRSRVDFVLSAEGLPDCYVEVKNTTWPTDDGGVGFPDAVTARGLKHIGDLRRMVRRGCRAVLLFVINRQDGALFRPAWERDPDYARALVRAAAAGVELLAYRVRIDPPEATLSDRLPIKLDAPAGG